MSSKSPPISMPVPNKKNGTPIFYNSHGIPYSGPSSLSTYVEFYEDGEKSIKNPPKREEVDPIKQEIPSDGIFPIELE